MKKYGFKDYAVDIEEVVCDGKLVKYMSKHNNYRISDGDEKLKAGETYFHVYVEYIV